VRERPRTADRASCPDALPRWLGHPCPSLRGAMGDLLPGCSPEVAWASLPKSSGCHGHFAHDLPRRLPGPSSEMDHPPSFVFLTIQGGVRNANLGLGRPRPSCKYRWGIGLYENWVKTAVSVTGGYTCVSVTIQGGADYGPPAVPGCAERLAEMNARMTARMTGRFGVVYHGQSTP
jgi:hypothetical protein